MKETLPLSELDGGPPPPRGDSVWSIIQHGIDYDPERAALVSLYQPVDHLESLVGKPSSPVKSTVDPKYQDSMLIWSYDQMQRGAARLGAILDRYNVPANSTILTFIPHGAEWSLIMWAAALKCHTLVCRTLQLLHSCSPDDQKLKEYYLLRLKPAVVVVEDEKSADIVDNLRQASNTDDNFFLGITLSPLSSQHSSSSKWISFADIASPQPPFTSQESSPSSQQVPDRPDRISNIFFTSGTTASQPKGVPRTTKMVCTSVASHCAWILPPPSGSKKVPRPQMTGLIFAANMMALSMSAPLIQWYMSNTVVLVLLAKHKAFSPERIRSVKGVFVSGEIITVGYLERMRAMLGFGKDVVFVAGFGMTEGVGALMYPPSVVLAEGWPRPLGDVMPVGTATPGTRVKVVGVQDGRAGGEEEGEEWKVVPHGKQGELHVSTDAYADRYLDGFAPEMFYTDKEGTKWTRTGDLAVIDEKGWVFVVGRMKDLVKSSDGFFNPTAIEAFLARFLSVEAVVIGIPSPMHGEMPYVIVERFPENVTAADISETFLQMAGSGFSLGDVITLEELGMKAWPLTITGKMQRHQLQKAAVAYLKTKDTSGYALD
ncbi:hypothetical protein B0T20DRAFT_491713, partial [Sordaria brevicollis]